MTKFQTELQKMVKRVKDTQTKLQDMLQQQEWIEEAKLYAEKQGREVQKLLKTDVEKVRAFLEKERHELEKFQARIPDEFKKLKNFIQEHRKDFGAILKGLPKKANETGTAKPEKAPSTKDRRKTPRNKT
jgi:predicted  nucleic acid-binding Zn-ribbon protein